MKVLPKTQKGGSPSIVDFVDAKETLPNDFSTGPGIDTKTNPKISNKKETERGLTSVPEYKDVGKVTGTSDKTSVLWSKKKLESFTEDELDKEISCICNSAPIDSCFTDLTKIGEGTFATVFRGTNNTTNEVVAIKEIQIDILDNEQLARRYVLLKKRKVLLELKVSKSFIHENIVRFVDAHSQSAKEKLTVSLVMEYMIGGSLERFLGEDNYAVKKRWMTEEEIATVCVQVLKGLKWLHENGVFHRDIKPENIMLSAEGLVKLGDFGSAANSREKHTQLAGSSYWSAPEVLQRLEYNEKVDIWSLGVVVIEVADGIPPHDALTGAALLNNIVYGKAPNIKLRPVSMQLNDLVSVCLNKDPSKRPSAESLLEHPFLANSKPPSILSRLIEEQRVKGAYTTCTPTQ